MPDDFPAHRALDAAAIVLGALALLAALNLALFHIGRWLAAGTPIA